MAYHEREKGEDQESSRESMFCSVGSQTTAHEGEPVQKEVPDTPYIVYLHIYTLGVKDYKKNGL